MPRWKIATCLLTASLAVGLRVALYDHEFFALARFPNHDISQEAGFFVANLHSLRTSGEIAWWKSNLQNGYAHYFQTFLSPLAPTPGHIAFIVYAQLVLALDLVGLRISEYYHYLVVTYLVLPWLAVAGFCWLTSLLVESRLAILLAGIVYALSGIGLWMGAWFFFQEPATLNFLLASSIALMQQPGRSRLLVWLSAVLIQAASFNYWTVYNAFFVVAFLGGYAALHLAQARSAALVAIRDGWRLTAWAAVVVAVWAVLLGSIVIEQGGRYARSSRPAGYTVEDVLARNRGTPLPLALSQLADRNSGLRWPDRNPMHRARYVGLMTIVLALCAIVLRPARSVAWLALALAAVAYISTALPPMLWLWARVPMMDRVLHLFYFYPHFLAQLVLLLAAIGLDRIRQGVNHARARVALACTIVALSVLDLAAYYRSVSQLDGAYTANVIWRPMHPMTPEKQQLLATPLPDPDPAQGFEGGIRNHLPILTWMFPDNVYLFARELLAAQAAKKELSRSPVLLVPDGAEQAVGVRYEATTWTYNTFALAIDVPVNGRLIVTQLPDPAWTYRLDGKAIATATAGFVDTSLPVAAGRHVVSMDYLPLARRLYWWAVLLLESTLAIFLFMALRPARPV